MISQLMVVLHPHKVGYHEPDNSMGLYEYRLYNPLDIPTGYRVVTMKVAIPIQPVAVDDG